MRIRELISENSAQHTVVGKLDSVGNLMPGHTAKPGQLLHTKKGPIGILGSRGQMQSDAQHADNLAHSQSGDTVHVQHNVTEAEGDEKGLPHLTKNLLQHIVDQIGTEGAHAIVKSLQWGDGAAKELLQLIKQDLENHISLAESVRQRLDPACWTGKHKEGTKIKGGVRVNNCVPNEGVAEGSRQNTGIPTGKDELYHYHLEAARISLGRAKEHHLQQAEKYKPKQGVAEGLTLDQQFDVIEEMVNQLALEHGVDADVIWDDFDAVDDDTLVETAAWYRKEGKNKKGGLNAKGVASYRKEHPGSKLQTAVTTPPSKLKPGSKAAKRRKSFCARMGGMKGPMKDEHGKPTRKALALRKWNC